MAHKSQKIDPSPLCKTSALAQSLAPLSLRTHHKFQKSEVFCTKRWGRPHLQNPLVRKMFALGKLLSPDFEHLLWMVPYSKLMYKADDFPKYIVSTRKRQRSFTTKVTPDSFRKFWFFPCFSVNFYCFYYGTF